MKGRAVEPSRQRVIGYLLAPVVVVATTAVLVALQNATGNGDIAASNHVYVTGLVLPVILTTYLSGRLGGAVTLLYTTPCSVYFLMAPRFSWKLNAPSDWIEIFIENLAGLILISGIDALKRNAALLQASQCRVEQEALINRIGHALRNSTNPEVIQQGAMEALGTALGADRCYFVAIDSDGNRAIVGTDWHRADLRSLAGHYKLDGFKPVIDAMRGQGHSIAVRNVNDGPFEVRIAEGLIQAGQTSGIIVPLLDGGDVVAALIVSMAETPRDWTDSQIAIVEYVATQVRGAVESARFREREHNIATALQQALQPDQPPQVVGLELATHYRAALAEASVGGDFSDVFTLDKGISCIVIGDLSGKGLAAAAQIALLRNMLRYALYRSTDLGVSISELNDTLIDHNLLAGFATLFIGVFDSAASTFTYVSCGHEPALLRRAESGRIEELPATGPAIGVISGSTYNFEVVPLLPSDTVLVYTDGVTEAGRGAPAFLGLSGLVRMFDSVPVELDADDAVKSLVKQIHRHADGRLHDDICIVLLRVDATRTGSAPSRSRITLRTRDLLSATATASFYREMLLAVTGGRLTLCEPEEIHGMVTGAPDIRHDLTNFEDVSKLRGDLVRRMGSSTLLDLRKHDICTVVTEAAANAVKHGGGGYAEAWLGRDNIAVLITDFGSGISPTELARATLESGFSTGRSLGMGFTMIMESVDTIALSTSETGTKILIRVAASPRLSLTDKFFGHDSPLRDAAKNI